MQAVREQAASSGKLMAMINVKIAVVLRKQRFHPGDLLRIFAQVSVQPDVGKLLTQLPHFFEQRRRRGRRKARRQRVAEPTAPVPALNQRPRVGIALRRRLQQRVRRVAIHHHLAGDQPHLDRFGGAE